jgi:Zn-dependent protease with chaperone function
MARQVLALSPSLLELLDEEELEGVVAHEMVHFLRRDNLMGWVPLVFRGLMFYNPVALSVFRGIAQENEKACDDRAVALTHKPLALAVALIKVFRRGQPVSYLPRNKAGGLASWGEVLSRRARRGLIEDRVLSLLHPARRQGPSHENLRLGLVAAVGGFFYHQVSWRKGPKLLTMATTLPAEELLKIAESMNR